MESKKINWNKILSGLIAGLSIAFICIFLGICFLVPVKVNVKALSKDDINNYNISFVSAKTKVKSAENYEKVKLSGYNGIDYYTYQYHYNTTIPQFYTASSQINNISIGLGAQKYSAYKNYSNSLTSNENGYFIPTNAVSFKNENTNSIEDVFYDEADNNDFVLINNYNTYAKNYSTLDGMHSFDVENFYLSFGTPYIDEDTHTTPIYTLSVSGKLFANGQSHNLVLNEVNTTYMLSSSTAPSRYWFQYFDLNNLKAYKYNNSDIDSTYAIEDQQGKYEITFSFIKYIKNEDNVWTAGTSQEKFVYSFYLLDSSNYDTIPTLTNANLGEISTNNSSQYYYNFTNDYPILTYDPSKFNLGYTRENREINETITSTFSVGTYVLDGKYYPKGILTFTDSNGNNKKQVFILGYYNENKTMLEYLYLANNSKEAITFPSTYDEILTLINQQKVDFEYKTTQILTSTPSGNVTNYSIIKYYTYDYSKREFSLTSNNYDNEIFTAEYIKDSTQTQKYSTTTHTFTEDGDIDVTIHNYTYSTNNVDFTPLTEIYEVDNNIVTNIKINNPLDCTNHNIKLLDKLNHLQSLDISNNNPTFEYQLVFDDLGIYTFDYNYNVTTYNSNNQTKNIVTNIVNPNNPEASTNILKINDFSHNYIKSVPATTPPTTSQDLTIDVWGYLSGDNVVNLNGVKYTYNPNANTLMFNDGSDVTVELNSSPSRVAKLGNARVDAAYAINTDSQGQFYLTISYKIATLKTTPYQTTYTAKKQTENYVINYENKIETKIEFLKDKSQTSTDLSSTLVKGENPDQTFINNWQDIITIFEQLEGTSQYTKQSYSSSSPNISQDILHIFGSMTYFNKDNPNATVTTSNNGKYKFRQKDSRLDTNYTADITKYVKSTKGFYSTSGFNVTTDLKNISDNGKTGLTNVAIYRGLDVNNIIVTDITPIFWKNLSSLLYNGKVSQSYIYRYPDYKIENGYINYGSNCITDLYTKDTYCSQDGLYEIVVLYKYDNYRSLDSTFNYNNTIFYQVFTFIIDNQSPSIDIKVQDTLDANNNGNTTEYITRLNGKYTNKNIEISWNKPTFFQNDVYIDVERLSYTNESEFKATYKQGKITASTGETYVNGTTSFANDNSKYYVYITSNDSYSSNGNYKVTLHYSSRGASTSTEEFVIDKQNISGMKVLPAVQNADGTYSVNYNNQSYTEGKQIINYDFTYRYNKKASNAKIYTYWYRIDLMSTTTSESDQIIQVGDKTAITTTFKVNGSDIESFSSPNQYIYNYNVDDSILNANYFTSNSSCIYLFKMFDEAGNECRYVVFYDTTTPRFKLSPQTTNNIINDTTTLTWGDYKAIKIETPDDFAFNDTNILNNYNISTNINNNLEEALTYINSATTSTFNNAKVKDIDDSGSFYMLLPITAVTIKDISSSTLNTTNSTTSITFENSNIPDNFYFFPTNPITDNVDNKTIYLGSYQNITSEDNVNISSYSYSKAINSDRVEFNRFVSAVSTTNSDYYGSIGKGEFTYQIYDGQRNKVEGYVWMTLDKTQTFAYGIFDTKTSDTPAQAQAITGEEGTYALSKLYISSLASSSSIPEYTLTYRFYELNDDMYENLLNNYEVYNVAIINKDNKPADLSVVDNQTYLQLTFKKNRENNYLTYYIELTDEDGNTSAKHSYPYDIQGVPGEPNSAGNPQHIYDVNKSSYTQTDGDNTRIFSNIINPTTDATGKTSTVTQEGLYIFKRMYSSASNLGLDSRIVYYVYYVDRTGIINVTTLNSISEQLYSNSQDFGFVLGSDYSDESLKKYINSNDLMNSQSDKDASATYSSTYNNISNLFTTNKTLVQFNVTADKYNFTAFANKFGSRISTKLSTLGLEESELTSLQNTISSYLFNQDYYSKNLYKINLTLAKGNVNIINESETDETKIYNTSAINSYLKGSYSTSGTRNNSFNLYLQDSNSNAYNVYLKDNSGYKLWSKDGALISNNYNPNQLDISFYIKQVAPTGDSYGKYYGRHNYDEDRNSSHSIPIKEYVDSNGVTQTTYALLEEYLQSGQLEPLSLNSKSESFNGDSGKYVQLYSTNNESLIFTFDLTLDDTQAQIDPNNIKIYKGAISDANLIFNRVNGSNIDTTLVNQSRQLSSIFTNEIHGVTKYAIVVFDNNLDEILNSDEKAYSNFRLLDSKDNSSSEKYFIQINYVGDKSNYIQEDSNRNRISFYSTTYEVTIDRNKPEYNLTKLMSLDKYVYNTVTTPVTTSNYESVFQSYKQFYHFQEDDTVKFERSDLENYFFALDYRKDSSFVFESINELDSSDGIYIRKVSPNNYKFSKTPDDYKSYYEATYLTGNPQFSSDRVTVLTKYSPTNTKINDTSKYYYIAYGSMSNSAEDKTIKVYDIMRFLEAGEYYEIIERDEAKNYRVYAVYLPTYLNTQIRFEYKENSNSDTKIGTLNYNSNPTVPNISGIEFSLTNYTTSDYFIKAILTINSKTLKESLNIYYSPKDTAIFVTTSTNLIRDKIENVSTLDYKEQFVNTINNLISSYDDTVSANNEHGYIINLVLVDRLGIKSSISETKLFNYELTYNVAGSILMPIFSNNSNYSNMFTMTIPAMNGTTYVEQVSAYVFQGGWSPKDPDDTGNSFSKTANEFKNGTNKDGSGTTYNLSKGVYKFVITDNFKRKNTYFYEYGTNNQSGGIINFSDKSVKYTDEYTYTSKSANFVYDNSIYDIYIKFVGQVGEMNYIDSDTNPHIVYSSTTNVSDSDLKQYGIKIAKIDNITTITFTGVGELTKYHIKTIPASISSQYNYTWGAEKSSDEYLVYDNKLAIYTAIESPIIRNANGNILDTSEHLHLSEDFEVTTAWTNGYAPEKQISFDSKIYLIRTYTENNVVRTEEISNSNSYSITKQGDYTAYVINSLNNKSNAISFTRGASEIGIYSVLNVDNGTSKKLSPSAKVTNESYQTEEEDRTLIEFNYFTTIDYFSFKDSLTNETIEPSLLVAFGEEDNFTNIGDVEIDRSSTKYLDIQVKSDLSIFVQLFELKKEGETPYAKFRIYSKNKEDKDYTYRFVKVYFLESTNYNLAQVLVSHISTSLLDGNAINNNIYDSSDTIKRPDTALFVAFRFKDSTNSIKYVDGNTMYVDRYFNGELVETISYTNISDQTEAQFTLTKVGIHKFVIRDLAGRMQVFGKDQSSSSSLQIYLINQILFEVNDASPIDNQIFNGDVTIKIQSELAGVTLYNTNTIGISVTRNGEEIGIADAREFTFTESGSYVVKMDATTTLNDQEISTTYKFVIVKTDVANNSFNISKGTGFEIDKIFKIVNNERIEMTEKFKNGETGESVNSGSLIWLTAKHQGNSIFEIHLKYFDQAIKDYQNFSFNVWLNNDQPVIISSINSGTATKDVITLHYNPGMIYNQVGKCKILINDKEYVAIEDNTDRAVKTITITQKGTYTIKIVSEDGSLISSYKYTKNDPISKTTTIVLVCIGIGIVVLAVLFLLIRRKGKYR